MVYMSKIMYFFKIRSEKSVNFLATEKKLRYNETEVREKQQKNI